MKYLKLYEDWEDLDDSEIFGTVAALFFDIIYLLISKKKAVRNKYSSILENIIGINVNKIINDKSYPDGSDVFEPIFIKMGINKAKEKYKELEKIESNLKNEESIKLEFVGEEEILNEVQAIADYGQITRCSIDYMDKSSDVMPTLEYHYSDTYMYTIVVSIYKSHCDRIISGNSHSILSPKKEIIDDIYHIKENLKLKNMEFVWDFNKANDFNILLYLYAKGKVNKIDN